MEPPDPPGKRGDYRALALGHTVQVVTDSSALIQPTHAQISTLAVLRGVLRRSRPRNVTIGERMQAVILADFVAESIAKLAAEALNVPGLREAGLPKVLGDLDAELKRRGLPRLFRGRVPQLHDLRNLVQHHAEAPAEAAATGAAVSVEDFAHELCAAVWGLSFRELSRTQLIEDPELRSLMEHAAAAIQRADRDSAVGALAHAAARFRALLHRLPAWAQRRWSFDLPVVFRDLGLRPSNEGDLRTLGETLDVLAAEHEDARAGLAGPDYVWFWRLVPELERYLDGHSEVTFPEPGPQVDELGRAYELLTDWIIEALPPIAPPTSDSQPWHVFSMNPGWPNEKPPDPSP